MRAYGMVASSTGPKNFCTLGMVNSKGKRVSFEAQQRHAAQRSRWSRARLLQPPPRLPPHRVSGVMWTPTAGANSTRPAQLSCHRSTASAEAWEIKGAAMWAGAMAGKEHRRRRSRRRCHCCSLACAGATFSRPRRPPRPMRRPPHQAAGAVAAREPRQALELGALPRGERRIVRQVVDQVGHGRDVGAQPRRRGRLRRPEAGGVVRQHRDAARRPGLEDCTAEGRAARAQRGGVGLAPRCWLPRRAAPRRAAPPPPPPPSRTSTPPPTPLSLRRQCSKWPCAQTSTHLAAPGGGSTASVNSAWPRAFVNDPVVTVAAMVARRRRLPLAGRGAARGEGGGARESALRAALRRPGAPPAAPPGPCRAAGLFRHAMRGCRDLIAAATWPGAAGDAGQAFAGRARGRWGVARGC
jgi:hypothetical protein